MRYCAAILELIVDFKIRFEVLLDCLRQPDVTSWECRIELVITMSIDLLTYRHIKVFYYFIW